MPSNFNNQFENAVFTRSKLVQTLNHEGSKLRDKERRETRRNECLIDKADFIIKIKTSPESLDC